MTGCAPSTAMEVRGALDFFGCFMFIRGCFRCYLELRHLNPYCPLRLFKFYLPSYNIVNMASEDKQLTQDYIVDKWKNKAFHAGSS